MKIYNKILLSVLLSTSFSFSVEDKENIDLQILNKENEIKELKSQAQNDAAKIIALKWREKFLKRRMAFAACDIQKLNNKKAKIIHQPSLKRDTDIVLYNPKKTVNLANSTESGSEGSLIPYNGARTIIPFSEKPSDFEDFQVRNSLNSRSSDLVPYDSSRAADLSSENRLVPSYSGNQVSTHHPQYRLNSPSFDLSSNYKMPSYHSPAGDLIPYSGKGKDSNYHLNDDTELGGGIRSNFASNSVAYDFEPYNSNGSSYKKPLRIGNGDGYQSDAYHSENKFTLPEFTSTSSLTNNIAFTTEQLKLLRPYVERLDKKTIYHYIVGDTLRALVPQRVDRGNYTGFKEVTIGILDNTRSKDSELLFKVSDALDILIYPNRQHMSAKLVYLGMHTIGLNNFTPKCCPGEQFQFKFVKKSDVLY